LAKAIYFLASFKLKQEEQKNMEKLHLLQLCTRSKGTWWMGVNGSYSSFDGATSGGGFI
jgi:hypothetical protein